MSGSGDFISREALVNEIWKALYSYEDEMEAKFMTDPELDVSQWFFHRIFVQTMSSIDLQVIQDAPAADVRPVVNTCETCGYKTEQIMVKPYDGACWFWKLHSIKNEEWCCHWKQREESCERNRGDEECRAQKN